jgi:hypothetical protein
MEAARIGARHDDEIGIAARRQRRLDLLHHEFGRHQVLDAYVMLDPARQQLVLDLDGGKAGGFRQRDGAMDVHGVAPAATGIKHDRQLAGGAHVDGDLRHFRQRDIGLGHTFVPTERAAAHVDRLEAGLLCKSRHDRIERHRRDDKIVAADQLAEFLQRTLLCHQSSFAPLALIGAAHFSISLSTKACR